MREQREEDRARYHKKRGKQCLPKKDRARSLKADAAATPAPPPTKEQASEPSAASSEHVTGPLVWKQPQESCTPEMKGSCVWQPPEEFCTSGYKVIQARHHTLRCSSDGQVKTEADGTVWRSVWLRCDSGGVRMVSPVHVEEQTLQTQDLPVSRSAMSLPALPPTHQRSLTVSSPLTATRDCQR